MKSRPELGGEARPAGCRPVRGLARALALALPLVLVEGAAAGPVGQDSPPAPAPVAGQVAADLERLSAHDPERAARWRRLVAGGAAAAQGALERLSGDPLGEQAELLARLVREAGSAQQLEPVCDLLQARVVAGFRARRALIAFLARPDHGARLAARRALTLGLVARVDPRSELRGQALEALGGLDAPRAVEELFLLIAELPPPERARAAAHVPSTPRSARAVRELVVLGFDPDAGSARTPNDVLAELLPKYGRQLADAELGSGHDAAERAPLVLGLKHPATIVRRAAALAFDELLTRLRELGAVERAQAMLSALAGSGLDARASHFHSARLAFWPGADPVLARAAARELASAPGEDSPGRGGAHERTLWRYRATHLEAMAELALGDAAAALVLAEEASDLLEDLLSQRQDLHADEASKVRFIDALNHRALAGITTAICRLAVDADDARVAACRDLRLAHESALIAQVHTTRVLGDSVFGWDDVLDSELSPFRLIFAGAELPGLSIEGGLALQRELGRCMAAIARGEAPGFAPAVDLGPERADPLVDPTRRELYERIFEARVEDVERRIDEVRDRLLRAQAVDPWRVPVQEEEALRELVRTKNRMLRDLVEATGAGERKLLEVRRPASLALWVARDLLGEGRSEEARALALQCRSDLDREGFWLSYYWGLERQAEIEMAVGSSWTDEGEPGKAELELLKAVERLEGVEERLESFGATDRQLRGVRSMRATALVSLAVNANVKLRDPAKALGYYEQAYELRQDDFMRVLLACYRARGGRGDEARALLREIRPTQQVYYNMACTYALLGETARALDFLEREFEENQGSRAALERQREWAREDPDLASLRGDPRFQDLVGGD